MMSVKLDNGVLFIEELVVYDKCLRGKYFDPELNDELISLLSRIVSYYHSRLYIFTDQNKKTFISSLVDDFRRMKAMNVNIEDINDAVDFLLANQINVSNFPYYLTTLTMPNEVDDTYYKIYLSILTKISEPSFEMKKKNYKNNLVKMMVTAKECLEEHRKKCGFYDLENRDFYAQQMCNVISYLAKNNIVRNDLHEIFEYIRKNLNSFYDYFNCNKTMDPRELKVLETRIVENLLDSFKAENKNIIIK